MQKFFKVLLVLGIILLLNAGYFLMIENEEISLFLAIFGLLIVIFSIFEIFIHRKKSEWKKLKVKKNEKPIALKAKKENLKSNIEWTSYDVWDEKKAKTLDSNDNELLKKEKKPSIFKRLFGSHKPPEKIKINAKIIEHEVKTEVKEKVVKVDKKDKELQLKEYIFTSLRNKIPKEKIIESALASDWPQEIVLKIFKGISRKKKRKKLSLLYVMLIMVFVLLGITLFNGEFLLFYWVESLSTFSPMAYGSMIIGLFMIIIISLLWFKINMAKRKKVYKKLNGENVEKLKEKINEPKKVSEVDASSYQTDMDRLLELVNKKGSVGIDSVAKIFNISKSEAEEWGKILKDESLISLYYPTVGDAELRKKEKVKEEEE
jgi:membrane protease YdiL (CAAX protease family)